MKVICDRGTLVDLLTVVGGVVLSRTPKPALTCVKMSAADGNLTLAATDAELSIRVTTNKVEVEEAGEALLPAAKVSQIVHESTDPTVSIETDGQTATILGSDSKFTVYGHAPADFPPVPTMPDDADFEMTAGELAQLIGQTIFATAKENSRYAINGVLVEREGNRVVMVATDGRRLAIAKGSCRGGGDDSRTIIVPTKALNLVQRVLADADQTVRVKVAENQVIFATDEAMLTSNLVEGNFPPYRDVVPKDCDKKATLSSALLASAVRRAALLTNEESKGVRLAFADGRLTLSSRAPEMGEAEVNIEVAKYDGDPIEIGFNPQFILDAMKVAEVEEVGMEFKAPNKPGILRTGSNFLYVIMPVNLA